MSAIAPIADKRGWDRLSAKCQKRIRSVQVEANTCTAVSSWPPTKMMRALVGLYRLNAYFCDVGHSKADRVGLGCL